MEMASSARGKGSAGQREAVSGIPSAAQERRRHCGLTECSCGDAQGADARLVLNSHNLGPVIIQARGAPCGPLGSFGLENAVKLC